MCIRDRREIDSAPQQFLDFETSFLAGITQARAALSDHDALLAVTLDINRRVELEQAVFTFFSIVDRRSKRVRQLFTSALESLSLIHI